MNSMVPSRKHRGLAEIQLRIAQSPQPTHSIASQNSPAFVPVLCTPSASASSADEPEIVALSGWAIRLPLSLDHSKRTWRDLICQAWPSDPLPCPKGQNEMRLIALIEEPLVIEKILRHLSLWCGLKKIRRSPITPRRSGVQPTTHRRRISD